MNPSLNPSFHTSDPISLSDRRSLGRLLAGRAGGLDLASISAAGWERLAQAALSEGVAPMVYHMLSEVGHLARLPEQPAKVLRAACFSTRMYNRAVLQELQALAGRFEAAGIPVVALKGICYALTVYPDIGLRPMLDLDLLVPGAQLAEAARIAGSCGYVETVPEAAPGLREVLNHEIALKKIEAPYTTLELHHSLIADRTYTFAAPVDWFWRQTEPLAGHFENQKPESLLMLSPTAQLLYAGAHAMLQHGARNSGLRWSYDLDRIVRAYAGRLDWDLLVSQARAFQWGSALEAALTQTVDLFETPVPGEVLAALRRTPDRNAARVARLQAPPATHTQEEYQKFQALNWYGRLRLALALAVPGPAYMRWRYGLEPSQALPAWYLRRWGGIFVDVWKTVIMWIQTVRSNRRPQRGPASDLSNGTFQ